MSSYLRMCALLAGLLVTQACIEVGAEGDAMCQDNGAICSGGDTTVFNMSPGAFGMPAQNLDESLREEFEIGRGVFHSRFLAEDEFAFPFSGLGPRFNDNSCGGCHQADGRANPYNDRDQPTPAILIRVSQLNEDGDAEPLPFYGSQLQPLAVDGEVGEMDVRVEWSFEEGTFDDGEAYELAIPRFRFTNPAHGRLPQGFMHSARATSSMIGLGLLEAIPSDELLAQADPDDEDLDGISGRPNIERDPETGARKVGRFGWKASHATLHTQNAAALLGDLGVVTETVGLAGCDEGAPTSECSEIDGRMLASVELDRRSQQALDFYTRHLAVPAARSFFDIGFDGAGRGEQLFKDAQCAACHTPSWTTAANHDQPTLAGQTIFPYTDLLLHDMGEGLADGRPDGVADGREWRTAPLWGIGLVSTVNGHTRFLHDGRARNLTEAVLWHGGEAAESRDRFKAMSFEDRELLLTFVQSL